MYNSIRYAKMVDTRNSRRPNSLEGLGEDKRRLGGTSEGPTLDESRIVSLRPDSNTEESARLALFI